jgi:SAM-dependent methyltransferase
MARVGVYYRHNTIMLAIFSIALLAAVLCTGIVLLYVAISDMRQAVLSAFGKISVPFVPLSHSTLEAIYKELDLMPSSVLYDLGCGDGRILRFCHDRMPEATYKGYDIGFEPLAFAYAKNWKVLSQKFSIRRKDFFSQDLRDATHIFLYLLPEAVDALLPKFERELAPGARVICADFPFSGKEPEKALVLKKPRLENGKKLFVYRF